MCKRSVCLLAVVLFATFGVRDSSADVITFDQAIDGVLLADDAGDPFDDCLVYCRYDVFTTQGFKFTAVENFGVGDDGEGVVVGPGLIPGLADNGTDYLLSGGITVMTRADAAEFSLVSVDASRIIGDDQTVAGFLRLFAFKDGVFFQSLHFELAQGAGFQTFFLPATWTELSRVHISGRLAPSGAAGADPWIVAVDNLNVPEPTSLMLFATGALAMFARARQRRSKA